MLDGFATVGEIHVGTSIYIRTRDMREDDEPINKRNHL